MILPLGRCGSVGCALPHCPLVPLPCGSQAPPHVCRRPRRLVHSHVLPAAETPGPSSQLRAFSLPRDESRARRRGGQGRVRPAPGAGLGGAGVWGSWRRNRAMSLSVPSADPPGSQVPRAGSSGRRVSGRAGRSGLGLPRKVAAPARRGRGRSTLVGKGCAGLCPAELSPGKLTSAYLPEIWGRLPKEVWLEFESLGVKGKVR